MVIITIAIKINKWQATKYETYIIDYKPKQTNTWCTIKLCKAYIYNMSLKLKLSSCCRKKKKRTIEVTKIQISNISYIFQYKDKNK